MSKPRKLPKGSAKTIVFNFFNFFNFLNFFNFPFLRKLSYLLLLVFRFVVLFLFLIFKNVHDRGFVYRYNKVVDH